VVSDEHSERLASTGRAFNEAAEAIAEAIEARRAAILAAARDGWTPAQIATAADASHETVRRVVRAAGL
jgi:DNA-directed RNA polymerase specialized sigma24 family protein